MTAKHTLACLLVVAGTFVLCSPSQAQDMNLSVGGEFYNATCGFIVNNGEDVDLGSHNLDIFNRVGAVAPWVDFNVTSTGCTPSTTRVYMKWTGTVDANNAGTFATTGTATGVAVWIRNGTNTLVPNTTLNLAPLANGQHYVYRAALHQTQAAVTEGTASAAITIEVSYN